MGRFRHNRFRQEKVDPEMRYSLCVHPSHPPVFAVAACGFRVIGLGLLVLVVHVDIGVVGALVPCTTRPWPVRFSACLSPAQGYPDKQGVLLLSPISTVSCPQYFAKYNDVEWTRIMFALLT